MAQLRHVRSIDIHDPNILKTLQDISIGDSIIGGIFTLQSLASKDDWYEYMGQYFKSDKRQFDNNCTFFESKWWEISNQLEKQMAYAFSTTSQPLHNDNAWFPDPAEVNLFFMEKQVQIGGEQIFYPLRNIIKDLIEEDLNLYRDLKKTKVKIKKGYTELEHITPILSENKDGSIYWNYYRIDKRDKFIHNLCERFKRFLDSKSKSDSCIKVKLQAGECLAFNDGKTLHGRMAFQAKRDRDRILYQSMWRNK